jgi:hypothetical protein
MHNAQKISGIDISSRGSATHLPRPPIGEPQSEKVAERVYRGMYEALAAVSVSYHQLSGAHAEVAL